jgi:hypothetical protein
MAARAISSDVLAVRRWRAMASPQEEKESLAERLLLVNFGDAEWREEKFGGGWRALLESGGHTQIDRHGVTVPARSATIFARDPA